MSELRVVVFGSRNLGAQHLEAMVQALGAVAASVAPETRLLLVHGDGPPGQRPGAIGADKLAEVAARLAWKGRPSAVRRHRAQWDKEGRAAGPIRNRRMAEGTGLPFRALCFHTDVDFMAAPGSGSADMARALARRGVGYTLVVLGNDGKQLRTEQRGGQG